MLSRLILFVFCIFYANTIFAVQEVSWLSQYQLTQQQIDLLELWTAEERFPEAFLHKTAQAFQNSNLRQAVYIPEHTVEDLVAVIAWAEGTAFAIFAQRAGYRFDSIAYENDCPHRALYNFGYATERAHLNQDVVRKYISTFTLLSHQYYLNSESFSEFFWTQALNSGFAKYLTPLSS